MVGQLYPDLIQLGLITFLLILNLGLALIVVYKLLLNVFFFSFGVL